MNIFEKFLLKRYKGSTLTFDFGSGIAAPISSKMVAPDSSIKISGTKYWLGNCVLSCSNNLTGEDCHLYIRTEYNGSIKNSSRISMEDTCTNLPMFSPGVTRGIYTINMDKLMVYSNLFISDKSKTRNGKILGKNYIHFKGKFRNNTSEFEGYLVFSDYAVESSFKKYLVTLYSELK